MRQRPRHSPRARLLLTLAALAALLVGYYLGQYWQRQPLESLSAVVYSDGKEVMLPAGLLTDPDPDNPSWRLFIAANTTRDACRSAMGRFALMMNRLAAWPRIQEQARLTVLAYDAPGDDAALRFRGGVDWADVVAADTSTLDRLASDLGILPDPLLWCDATQLNGVLVAPDRRRWALIPYEDPQTMAYNVQAVIQFVD